MNRVRVDTSQTATANQAKQYINIGLMDMHISFGETFSWAERHATLITQPTYSTGTVTVSQGSTSLTGTDTLWNTNNVFGVANMRAGGKIVINGSQTVYRVASVAGDTAATLDARFVDSDVTDGTYVYFEDEYDLSADFLRPIDLQFFDSASEIELISRTDFRRQHPRNKLPGKIMAATIEDRAFSGNTTPRRRVRFYKPPDQAYHVPYNFVTNKLAVSSAGAAQTQLSADTDEPIVPLQYRHAIVFHALYHWYRDKKDDTREAGAKAEYTDLILRIAGDQEIGARRPRLAVMTSGYARRARSPYSRAVFGD
jgi:hypothetical protein